MTSSIGPAVAAPAGETCLKEAAAGRAQGLGGLINELPAGGRVENVDVGGVAVQQSERWARRIDRRGGRRL